MKVFEQQISLKLNAKQVREFIMTPERILDYYPQGIESFVVKPQQSIICRGTGGASLLELINESENTTTIKVTSALLFKPPFTAERIKAQCLFTMIEDWQVDEHDEGCMLTKVWRDIEKHRLRFLPMAWIVRNTAKKESSKLQNSWNSVVNIST